MTKTKNKIKVGSDFSGVGAFDQALKRLSINYETIFACDMDKFARQTYIENYGEPKYFPKNVYEREIPLESLDVYMTSPPCQSFSLAGKRKGKDDERGILFFNSHEFIKTNKPRFFIFENIKGLLSDDNGRTFGEWIRMLGGKSVDGLPVLFPDENSVPYHIYSKVLNAKKHGVPQNRERVFIVGVRDNVDNYFRWSKEQTLNKKLIDVLESNVDEKYFLSLENIENISVKFDNSRNYIQVKENTKKGFKTAFRGDGFYINRTESKRGVVQKNSIPCIKTSIDVGLLDMNENIRKPTPRECFRLMDFPDSFIWSGSDNQAYKQAANSIVVGVLSEIIKKLKF